MSSSSSSSFSVNPVMPTLLASDFEVDGLSLYNRKTKKQERPNITEGCLKVFKQSEKTNYIITYSSRPKNPVEEGSYQKKIPKDCIRQPIPTCLRILRDYIDEERKNGLAYIMVYNKSWDEELFKTNCKRYKIAADWSKIKFFDIAEVIQELGFPRGMTLSNTAEAYYPLPEPPPGNRHRAHPDTRLLVLVTRVLFKNAYRDLAAFATALHSKYPERSVAAYLKVCDPALLDPIPMMTAKIQAIREERLAVRRCCIPVGADTETTGIEKKEPSHHEKIIRVLQFGAVPLSLDGNFTQEDKFCRFANPGQSAEIQPKALETHGISKEVVQGEGVLRMTEVWNDFVQHIQNSRALESIFQAYQEKHPAEGLTLEAFKYTMVLFGYNINRFDKPLLEQELMLGGYDLKQASSHGVFRTYDFFPLAQVFFTGMKNGPQGRKLTDLAKFYDIPTEGAHDAANDVEILIRVAQKMCEPLNLTTVLIELSMFMKNPGLASKQIIFKAKELVATGMDPDGAVKEAAELYRTKVVIEKNEPKIKGEKRTRDEDEDDSVEENSPKRYEVASYPYGSYASSQPLGYL